ncbi:MAG: PGF-pre-PGF domain-containing protein [Candidatus Micrarchaeia archaeon]
MKKIVGIFLAFFLFGLLSAVSIDLISPENNTFTNQKTVAFMFNATDNETTNLICSLYINSALNMTNSSVENNSITIFTQIFFDGNYLWYINCSNGTDFAISEIRNLTIDSYPVNVSFTIVEEPDYFVSSDPANNRITLLVNASDIGPAGIDYLTANFTALRQPGISYINMTYNDTTGLWNATITVTNVSNFEFTPLNVSVFGQDKAGNGLVGWTYTTVILYNMSVPPVGSECQAWGPLMTNLTKISDFNSVNFIIDLQMNISCLTNTTFSSPYPSWLNEMTTLALLNFSNVNLSDQSIGMKLGNLFQNIKVNITLPGQFGDSRIYVNSYALQEFDTNTTIKLFHLPFLSKPEIESDGDAKGLDNSFQILWEQGIGEGNLTFKVKGFSGYNISDSSPPVIKLENIDNGSYVNSSTPLINLTLNGTKTKISYLFVKIDDVNYTYNTTVNETNCQETLDPEIMSCVFTSSNLSQGNHTLFILARDYGGSNGNVANKSIVFFVDSLKPTLNVSSPENDTVYNSVTINVIGTSLDSNLNYTNVSIYNITNEIENYSITSNSSWIMRFILKNGSTYNVSIKTYDKAGNYETILIKNITINDSYAPNITAISATTSGLTVTLSVTTDEFAVCRFATSDIDYENMSNMTTTGGVSHSHSITYSSTTSGTYYVRCADPIGNTMNTSNSTTFSVVKSSGGSGSSSQQTTNITTPLPPITPPVTQPQPEETPAPTTPVSIVSSTASTAVFSLNAVAGESINIDIAKMASGVAQGTGISKISIATRSAVSNVQVSIKPVEKPSSIPEPSKKVLNYIEISFGGASDAVQSAKLTFTLKKSDIRKQNIDSDTIKLLRYANGQWQELQTVKGFEDLESITFEATTPGFSYFAIAGDEIKAPAEIPKVTTTTEEEPGITVVSQKKEESPLGLILLLAVILIIGYIVLSSQKPWKIK